MSSAAPVFNSRTISNFSFDPSVIERGQKFIKTAAKVNQVQEVHFTVNVTRELLNSRVTRYVRVKEEDPWVFSGMEGEFKEIIHLPTPEEIMKDAKAGLLKDRDGVRTRERIVTHISSTYEKEFAVEQMEDADWEETIRDMFQEIIQDIQDYTQDAKSFSASEITVTVYDKNKRECDRVKLN